MWPVCSIGGEGNVKVGIAYALALANWLGCMSAKGAVVLSKSD